MHSSCGVSFFQGLVLLQYDPDVAVVLQLIEDSHFHIDLTAAFKSHAHSQPRVLGVEVLIAVEGHVTQPPDLLVSCPAEHREELVAHMHIYLQRLLYLALAPRHLARTSLVMQFHH